MAEQGIFVKVYRIYSDLIVKSLIEKKLTLNDLLVMQKLISKMRVKKAVRFTNHELYRILDTDTNRLAVILKRLKNLNILKKIEGMWCVNPEFICTQDGSRRLDLIAAYKSGELTIDDD